MMVLHNRVAPAVDIKCCCRSGDFPDSLRTEICVCWCSSINLGEAIDPIIAVLMNPRCGTRAFVKQVASCIVTITTDAVGSGIDREIRLADRDIASISLL